MIPSVKSVSWLKQNNKVRKSHRDETPSFCYFVSLFHAPSLKGIIKQVRLKTWPFFFTIVRIQVKIFLLFCNCPSFTHLVLSSVLYIPYTKVIEKLLNSFLLLAPFLAKPTGIFSPVTLCWAFVALVRVGASQRIPLSALARNPHKGPDCR